MSCVAIISTIISCSVQKQKDVLFLRGDMGFSAKKYEVQYKTCLDSLDFDTVEYSVNTIGEYFVVTYDERELLAKLVHEEGNNQSLECQKGIVSVVFNRVYNKSFNENTIYDVIYAPGQFTVVPLLVDTVPTEVNYEAVDCVLNNGPTLPYYVCFFRSKHYFNNYTPYCSIDNTYFSYSESHM